MIIEYNAMSRRSGKTYNAKELYKQLSNSLMIIRRLNDSRHFYYDIDDICSVKQINNSFLNGSNYDNIIIDDVEINNDTYIELIRYCSIVKCNIYIFTTIEKSYNVDHFNFIKICKLDSLTEHECLTRFINKYGHDEINSFNNLYYNFITDKYTKLIIHPVSLSVLDMSDGLTEFRANQELKNIFLK